MGDEKKSFDVVVRKEDGELVEHNGSYLVVLLGNQTTIPNFYSSAEVEIVSSHNLYDIPMFIRELSDWVGRISEKLSADEKKFVIDQLLNYNVVEREGDFFGLKS